MVVVKGSAEAAAVVWNWRDDAARSRAAAPGRVRLAGSLRALVVAGVGAALYALWSPTVGAVALAMAGAIALSALISPTALYPALQGLFARLGLWTGRALTWALMVPLFYLFFLPFGKLLRRGRRDRLKRFTEAGPASYWEPREGPTVASASRLRQY